VATLNEVIYTRAIAEIDDPFITASYNENAISFFKTMYNFLVNAIPLYVSPTTIIDILNDRTEPDGQIELFNGNGTMVDFVLSSTPTSNAYFSCAVNEVYVSCTFNSTTNTVSVSSPPLTGTENVEIEWYDTGYFNQTLTPIRQNVLACFLVSCWGEKEKNFLIDIRRLLNDSTFKLSAESTTMKSKDSWYYNMREKAEKLMNQSDWVDHVAIFKTRYGIT
jgi:hypothetical protein